MESGEKPQSWWFALGLLTSMLVCLCLGVVMMGTGYLGSLMVRIFSQESGTVASPTLPAQPEGSETSAPLEEPFSSVPTAEMDMAARSLEILSETIVPASDLVSLAQRLQGLGDVPRYLAEVADPVPIGTIESFWVSNNDENINFQVEAELVYATEHAYFWVESEVEYDLDDVIDLLDEFENEIYPSNRDFFGSEWTPGVDGDPHLYILYSRGLGNSVAGLFGPNDEFSSLIHPYSNGHEMFYLSADNQLLWTEYTRGVLAHEFQHMIHWYRDANEDTWMNEGLSELAVELNGYDIGGFDHLYASDPDITLGYWPPSGEAAANYGQSFLFIVYFYDRFGMEATQMLVIDEANGLDSIDRTLASLGLTDPQSGEIFSADDIFADWAAALYLQDTSLSDGRYGFRVYNPPLPVPADQFFECPVEEQARQVSQYGVDYIQLRCSGDFTLSFNGIQTVQVLPVDPRSGSYAFWSNKGDTSDMTLTRAFDFSQHSGVIEFDYWVWYDIEEDWDYLYLEASTDGGATWEILDTPSGTDTNPSGNSYGWGYTGFSGGGSDAVWIQESVDLSAFAGQEVLLRFEYVTDAAVNGEGLLLDDLSIEAVEYKEDFESGDGGWEAEGFVRLYNRLPQEYKLLLLEIGEQTRVREMMLDDNRHGEIDLSLGGTYEDAILIVIGAARHTWQPAFYRFEVSP